MVTLYNEEKEDIPLPGQEPVESSSGASQGGLKTSTPSVESPLPLAIPKVDAINILGKIFQRNLEIANRNWTQTCVFSVTDADTVAWAAGTLTSADGTAFAISAGNTGNMTAKTFIYFDTLASKTEYQITTTASVAVGVGKVLVAIAQNATVEAKFMVMIDNSYNIDAANIVANSITANELSTSITYAGSIIIDTAGLIRSGQTAYDTGTGWWIGNDGGTPKLSIGNPSGTNMTWDGVELLVNGLGINTFSGDASDGDITLDGIADYNTFSSRSGS